MYLNSHQKIPVCVNLLFGLFLIIFSLGALADNKEYLLLPDDILQITVWKEADLQREVLIRPDGKISFPLAGHIVAAGYTVEDVERAITEKLSRFIPDPVVTVAIIKLMGYKIYILGKVARPGEYVVSQINIMQALSLAGGLARFADEKNINVLRQSDGTQHAILFNYNDVADGKNLGQNISLQPGDVLVVR